MLYEETIKANMTAIDTLDAERYPELHKLMTRGNSSLHAHLFILWWELSKHNAPIYIDKSGRGYHTLAINSHLMKLETGGTAETWQSHLIFLRDTGLIMGMIPDKKTKIKELKGLYLEAKRQGKATPVCYSMVALTDEVLEEAERVAARYAALKIGVSHIRKSEVIAASGQERANILYADKRKILKAEDDMRAAAVNIIRTQIDSNGYTTVPAVFTELRKAAHTKREYKAVNKLKTRIQTLVYLAGAESHPQRKKDRERFQLETRCHIITRAEA